MTGVHVPDDNEDHPLPSPHKVLLIEDQPGDARLVQELLHDEAEDAFEVIHVSTLREGLQALAETQAFGVVLLDLGLPDSQGLDTFDQVHRAARDIPVVIFTGSRNDYLITTAMRQGAQDYLDKNALSGMLIARTIRYSQLRQEAERALRAREAQQAAIADLGQFALAEPDLQRVFNHAVRVVARTLHTDYCKVLERLPTGDALLLRAGVGWQPGLVGQATVGTDLDSQAGYTLASVKPVIVKDLRREDRFHGPPLLLNHGVISGMSVIIGGVDQPYGVLGTHTTTERSFNQDDVNFLQAVANVLADAVERDQAQAQNTFQSSLLEQVHSAVIATDLEGRVTYWNPFAEQLYGWSSTEALGRSTVELTVPPESHAEAAEILRAVATSGRWEGEFIVQRKDGHTFPVWETLTQVRDAQGRVQGYVGVTSDRTEQHETERQLLESQAHFQRLFHGNPVPITLMSLEGGMLVDVNDSFVEVFGYSRKTLISQRPTDIGLWVNLRDRDVVRKQLAEHGSCRAFETQLRTQAGEVRDVLLSLEVIRLDEVPHILGVVMDITARKALEREQAQYLEGYRLTAKATNDLLYDLDVVSNIVRFSGVIESEYGYGPDCQDVPLDWWEAHLHPDDRERVLNEYDTLFQQGKDTVTSEYRFQCADGSYRYVIDRGFLVRDAQGTPVRMIGAITDLSHIREAQEAQRASEEQLRLILASAAEAIYGLDTQGNCTFVNPACLAFLGYDHADELLGKNMHDLIHHSYADGSPYPVEACSIYQAFRQGKPVHVDDEVLWRRDGTSFPAEYWSHPIVKKDQVLGSVVTFLDITDRKRLEAERHRYMNDLAERVKELSTLHQVSGLLRDEDQDLQTLLPEVVDRMPGGWLRPNVTAACLSIGVMQISTSNFMLSRWMQQVEFILSDSTPCALQVSYLAESDVDPFLPDEHDMLRSLAEMLRAYLDRRHAKEAIEALNADLAKRVVRLGALRQIDTAITTQHDMGDTLSQVVHQAQQSLGVDTVEVFLYEPSAHRLRRMASVGFWVMTDERFYIEIDETAKYARQTVVERIPVFVPDVQAADPPFSKQALLDQEGFVSHYALPLIAKGTLHGVLSLFHRAPLDVSEDWQAFAQALALQAAIAIDSARSLKTCSKPTLIWH